MKINYLVIGLAMVLAFTGFQNKLEGQTVVFDQEIYWEWPTSDNIYGGYGFYWWHRNEGVVNINYGDMSPTDWLSPNNYYDGQFTLEFEVLEQPTSEPFQIQFGIWQDIGVANHPETQSSRFVVSGGAGSSISVSMGAPNSWWNKEGDNPVDFSRPEDFYRIGVVLWKILNEWEQCIPKGEDWGGGCPEYQDQFFPMRARVKVLAYPSSSVPTHQVTFNVKDEGGNPVGGANVNVSGANVTANSSGQAFIDLQDGTYNYTVSKSGFNNATGSVTVSGGNVTENVTLTAAASTYTVTFSVKDGGGNVVEGANVNVNGTNITTGGDGNAYIDLGDGNYNYTVSKSGFDNATGSVNVSGSATTENVTLNSTPYTVTFDVKDSGGNPVDGASVSVNGTSISTGGDGKAYIDLQNGDYSYTVSKSGYNSASGSVNVSGSATTEIVTLTQPTYTVTFNVTDGSASAVEGASISINSGSLSTNASGQASTDLVNGTYNYTVTKAGYGNASGSVTVSGSNVNEDVTLSLSSYTVTFAVVDESDDPVQGAGVSVDGNNLTTDTDGNASVTLVNGTYDYTVTKAGYDTQNGSVDVNGANVTENVSLVVSMYSVTFNVTDESVSPIEGADISIDGNSLSTNASGEASISLPGGSYSYTVTKSGYEQSSGNVTVSGSDVTQDVTLTVPGYTVTFNVTDQNTNAVEGANISVEGNNLSTDATGQASLDLADGSYSYTVSKSGYTETSGTVNVSGSDLTENVSLTMIAYTVTFVVTNQSANPIEGASVSVNGNNLITNSSGKVTVDLPDGSHNYTASKTGHQGSSGTVTVNGEDLTEFVNLAEILYTVTFNVTDNNANPVEGATITINTSTITTDQSGNATMEMLEGTYSYTVSKDGYDNEDGNFSVADSDITENITLGAPSSVNSLVADNVEIYPNPGSDIIYVTNSSAFRTATEFAIFSVIGEKIYSISNPVESDRVTLNLTNVPKGIYFLRINTGDESVTRRLVIQ